ncbi:uncharacterized protein CXorf49 homolog [Suncus etruscus]|uniref:uncharacterized protein CXorf49 homolog n=1 Tax=Suncus etruscus TaxID=109475 RepID=UPI002110271D|nr:uncharacterized protein CXorf49 homolog [Suncus etruscus]
MSAPEDEDKDEVTLRGGNEGLEGEELASVGGTGFKGPSTPGIGLNLGVLLRSKAEGGVQGLWGSEWEPKDLAVGEAVLYGQGGPHGTSANRRHDPWDDWDDDGPDPVALVPPTTQESGAARMPQVLYTELQDVERSLSPMSCWDEDSTPWRGLNSVTRAPFPRGHGEAWPHLANPPLLLGCKDGRGGRMTGRGSRGGWSPPRDKQGPFAVGLAKLPSEPESPGDFGELQRRRDGKAASRAGASRGRGPSITHGPVSSSIAGRQSKFPWSENVLSMRGSTPRSLPRRGTTSLERWAVAGQDKSASKTLPNVVLGKSQDKSSYSGVSLSTSPPQSTTKMVTQDKKYLRGPSKLTLGRGTPSWGQRTVPAPKQPATFPPISGVKFSGGPERGSLVPLPSKQPKQTGASGKKYETWRPREYEQLARDDDPNRDRSPMGQIQETRLKLSGQRVHVAQGGSGNSDIKIQKTPGDIGAFVLNQGQIMARGPARSGDLEQPEDSPEPELLQLAPESVNCPRLLTHIPPYLETAEEATYSEFRVQSQLKGKIESAGMLAMGTFIQAPPFQLNQGQDQK